jgi:DNA polymerase-3 subunit gamma/tau
MDLHTKYRPAELDGVIGQKHIIKSLARVLETESTRAFIFKGPSGTGKTTLGRIIANLVGCSARNLVEVDAASKTGIDDMRAIVEPLLYSALGASKTRVYIIDEAHMLSKAAWNSLLKSVEEPPPGVYWIFCTTEASKIPGTISNRCAAYELKPVDKDEIHSLLRRIKKKEGFETPDEVVYLIAEKSHGSVRQAITALGMCSECTDRKEAGKIIEAAGGRGRAH